MVYVVNGTIVKKRIISFLTKIQCRLKREITIMYIIMKSKKMMFSYLIYEQKHY